MEDFRGPHFWLKGRKTPKSTKMALFGPFLGIPKRVQNRRKWPFLRNSRKWPFWTKKSLFEKPQKVEKTAVFRPFATCAKKIGVFCPPFAKKSSGKNGNAFSKVTFFRVLEGTFRRALIFRPKENRQDRGHFWTFFFVFLIATSLTVKKIQWNPLFVKKGNCKTVKNEKPSKTVKMVIFERFCPFSRKPQKVRVFALLGDPENAPKSDQNRGFWPFLRIFDFCPFRENPRFPSILLIFGGFWPFWRFWSIQG